MIHVAGGDDQHRLALGADYLGESLPEFFKGFKMACAQRYRHKTQLRLAGLQEWELNFRRVLGAVGLRVFAKQRELLSQSLGQRRIDGHVT